MANKKYISNEYANATPERKKQLNAATLKWRELNPEKIAAIRKRTDEKRKFERRNKILEKEYGISLAIYNQMLENQNYVCAICFQPEKHLGKDGCIRPLNVDHCHTTGKVRGLLCAACNLGLGNMEDNEQRLFNAIEYLRKSRGK